MNDLQTAQGLKVLQRQYFQLVEPHQLRWPGNSILKSPDVQSWMYSNMFDANITQSPPPDRYQLRILKMLISKLERSIETPEEDVRLPFLSLFSYSIALNEIFYLLSRGYPHAVSVIIADIFSYSQGNIK